MKTFFLSEDELDILVEYIFLKLPKGGIVLLQGGLAAGKTTLVKKIATFLHVEESEVSSPTFSVLNRYKDGFYHYDIYNGGFDRMVEIGLFENLEEEGYHFIEWGDKKLEEALKQCGFSYMTIDIFAKQNKRLYKVFKCIN